MSRRNAAGGYTLVEISVSLLVVGIGFLSVLSIFPVGMKWCRDAMTHSTAPLAALSAMDEYPASATSGVAIDLAKASGSATVTNSVLGFLHYAVDLSNLANPGDSASTELLSGYYVLRSVLKNITPPGAANPIYAVHVACYLSKKSYDKGELPLETFVTYRIE